MPDAATELGRRIAAVSNGCKLLEKQSVHLLDGSGNGGLKPIIEQRRRQRCRRIKRPGNSGLELLDHASQTLFDIERLLLFQAVVQKLVIAAHADDDFLPNRLEIDVLWKINALEGPRCIESQHAFRPLATGDDIQQERTIPVFLQQEFEEAASHLVDGVVIVMDTFLGKAQRALRLLQHPLHESSGQQLLLREVVLHQVAADAARFGDGAVRGTAVSVRAELPPGFPDDLIFKSVVSRSRHAPSLPPRFLDVYRFPNYYTRQGLREQHHAHVVDAHERKDGICTPSRKVWPT